MADLEYKIKTVADLEALKQSQRAMKEATGTTAELDKSTKSLKEQKKGLIDQLKVLRHEIPQLSQVIHLVKNPFVALAVGIGIVVDQFNKFTEKVKEAARAVEPFDHIAAQFGKFRAVTEESRASAEEFARALAKIHQEASTAETRFNSLTKQIDDQAKASEALRKARVDLAKAEIDLALAQGKISPVEAARRTEHLEEAASAGDRGAAARAAGLRYFATVGRISQTQSALGTAAQGLPGLIGQGEAAHRNALIAGALATKTGAANDTEIGNLRKELEQSEGIGRLGGSPFGKHRSPEEIRAEIVAKEAQSADAAAAAQHAVNEAKAADEAIADAKQKILADTQALQKLTEEKLAQEQSIALEQATAAAAGTLGAQAGRTRLTAKEIELGTGAATHLGQLNTEINATRQRGGDDSILIEQRRRELQLLRELGINLIDTYEGILRQIKGLQSQVQNPQ